MEKALSEEGETLCERNWSLSLRLKILFFEIKLRLSDKVLVKIVSNLTMINLNLNWNTEKCITL